MAKRQYRLKPIEKGTAFEGLFNDCNELETLLLTHKETWYIAEKIIENGTIPIEDCDVFGEKLQYYFYGRPSYVTAQGSGYRKDHLYFPVCFLIDPDCVKIDSIFPFDSGAFADEFYDDYIEKTMDINKFLINPKIPSVKGFISYFYGDNEHYYTRKVKQRNTSYDTPAELCAYINIVNASGAPSFDSRAETIEIITKNPVNIYKGVRALVIPNEFECVAPIKKAMDKMRSNGVTVITYPLIGLSPEQYNSIVYEKVYDYFCSNGSIHKSKTAGNIV